MVDFSFNVLDTEIARLEKEIKFGSIRASVPRYLPSFDPQSDSFLP